MIQRFQLLKRLNYKLLQPKIHYKPCLFKSTIDSKVQNQLKNEQQIHQNLNQNKFENNTHSPEQSHASSPKQKDGGLVMYRDRNFFELVSFLFIYKLCTIPSFVRNVDKIYNGAVRLFGIPLTDGLIKMTMAKIFTAGCDQNDLLNTLEWGKDKGFHIMTCYHDEAVEGYIQTDQDIEFTKQNIISTIEVTTQFDKHNCSAVKFSALSKIEILKLQNQFQEKLQKVYDQIKKSNPNQVTAEEVETYYKSIGLQFSAQEFDEYLKLFFNSSRNQAISKFDWKLNLHAFYLDNLQKNHNKIFRQLCPYNDEQFDYMMKYSISVLEICDKAQEKRCRVMVDAEQSYLQKGIDSFAEQLQIKYNKEFPLISNTMQNYLIETKDKIDWEIEKCKKLNLPLSYKMVRGAYMVEENKITSSQGKKSIICESLEETTQSYHTNLEKLFNNITPNSKIVIASHNENTCKYGQELMKQHNIDKKSGMVYFAQLKGLSDNLTFSLVDEDYEVIKLMIHGKIHKMVPYLIRRSQEQIQMLSSVERQMNLIQKELDNRYGV